MHRHPRPEGLQLTSPDYQPSSPPPRDRVSMSPSYSLASAPPVNPDPAYIAASAAAQIITSDYRSHFSDGTDHQPSQNSYTAVVAPASLTLVNAFLDRLLYNFLASARSTSLGSLRPAVQEVLKPRLAKEAIAGADEEIEEFLGGGDEEELLAFHGGQEPTGEWDLDLVWRRTRLRCMVYTRLGDMEEEEEDMYISQEHLDEMSDERRLSRDLGNVSPAVAIFLTSILEFVGELALTIAGDAAYNKNEYAKSRGQRQRTQEILVEEIDMEKVAFNATLGRLWRSWRRLVRSPANSMSRRMSLDRPNLSGMRNFSHNGPIQESKYSGEDDPSMPPPNQVVPSSRDVEADPQSIPLPSNENDVAEIEVPGYAPLAERRLHISQASFNRPHSMVGLTAFDNLMYSPVQSRPQSSVITAGSFDDEAIVGRTRSHSLPPNAEIPSTEGERIEDHQATESQVVHSTDATPSLRPRDMPVEQTITSKALKGLKKDSPTSLGPSSGGSAGSMPTTPLQGSVLNAISRHAARELSVSSSAASEVPSSRREAFDEAEPQRKEHAEIHSETQPDQYFGPGPRSIVRQGVPSMLDATKVDDGGVSPIIGAVSPLVGAVSPIGDEFPASMDPSSFHPDISPIDDDDEEPAFIYSNSNESLDEGEEDEDDFNLTTNEDYAIQSTPQRGGIPMSVPAQIPARNAPVAEPKPLNIRPRRVLTSDEIAKGDNREAYVVDDSSSQSGRNSGNSSISGKDLQLDGTIANRRVRTGGAGDGVPPLTPLRETVEVTQESPEEVLPAAVNQKIRLQSSYNTRTESPSSTYAHARNPSAPSALDRSSDSRNQLPVLNTDSYSDRAGVQRLSPADSTFREPTTPQGRRSESSARLLPAPTSGSSPVSQKLKGLVGWQQYGDDSAGTPRLSSDRSRSATIGNTTRSGDGGDEKQRSFDQLIQSDQTIQYTLTPNVMRQIEGAESPRFVSQTKGRSPESIPLADNMSGPRNAQLSSKPQNVLNGLSSNPSKPSANKVPRTPSTVVNRGSSKPSFLISSGPTTKPVPKDARGEETSLRDIADFLRNTGPEQAKTLPKLPLSSGSTNTRKVSAGSDKKASPASKTSSGRLAKSPTPTAAPVLNGKKSEIKAARRSATGSRLQAREAAVQRSDQSSDLIDFIRQGPPADHAVGAHRIPRAVAPFRSTMDSDEIQALGHGKARDASSLTSTQDSLLNTRSIQSSINSRTGLIDPPSRSHPKSTSNPSPVEQRPTRSGSPPPGYPKRKQRRVKDPYAIDSDSDDEVLANTPKPRREEESLLDFLNSVAPPTQNGPTPVAVKSAFDGMPDKNANSRTLQRKISASSMRARFTRSGSLGPPNAAPANSSAPRSPNNPNGSQPSPTASMQSSSNGLSSPHNGSGNIRPNTQTVSAFPRATSPHLQPNPKSNRQEQYKPMSPTYAGHVERQRNASAPVSSGGAGTQVSSSRRPKQVPQPRTERVREPFGGQDSTHDLADFFKNSGPPEGVASGRGARPESAASVRDDREGSQVGGFSRMFSRRKKAGVA